MKCFVLFFLPYLILTSSAILAMQSNNTSVVHLVAFVPYLTGGNQIKSDHFGYKAAIQMAVDIVNNRTDILRDYKIKVHFGETYAHAAVAQKAFIDLVTKGPTKIGLLGPAYSVAAQPVAQLAGLYRIPQITYASLLPELVNHNKFPFFFRSTPSLISFNEAKLAILKYFKWRRVGIIYDYSQTLNFQSIDHLQKLLKKNGFEVIAIEGFSIDFDASSANEVKKMKDLDARIIITEVSITGARSVFCEAYRQNMFGDNYVWFTSASLGTTWYHNTKPFDSFCTPAQLRAAVDGHFYVTRMDLRNDGAITASGLTAPEFFTKLTDEVPHASTLASFAFDAVWILAKTLHNLSYSYNLSDFKYFDPSYSYYVYAKTILKTDFEAISGPLRFSENSERKGYILFGQFRNDTRQSTALHSSSSGNLTFFPNRKEQLFNGKEPPLDHTVKIYVARALSVSVIAVMWSLACFGLIIALFFLYFNIKYKQNRLIKMSSPMINNIIVIGSILCYTAVILHGLDTRLIQKVYISSMCNVFVWVLTVGFTLSFGALFSKTWRVYKIFTAAKSMERVAILDRHLFGIIFFLFGIDVILLTIWMLISPYNMKVSELSRVSNSLRDVIEVTQVYHCSAKYSLYFSSGALAYKGVLLFFGLFLAWETRKVEVLALNDSKFIGMAVYNVAAISAIGVMCSYALNAADSFEANYTVVCLCIVLCTTVTLCLVFVPKLTLLFSKESASATETARFSTLTRGARSTTFEAKRTQSLDSQMVNAGKSSQQVISQSVTTLSSCSSMPSDCRFFNSSDMKSWSTSMIGLSRNSKFEEDLTLPMTTNGALPCIQKNNDLGSSKPISANHPPTKSDESCEQHVSTMNDQVISRDDPMAQPITDSPPLDVESVDSPLSDGESRRSSIGVIQQADLSESSSVYPKLPNGVSCEGDPSADTDDKGVTPRLLPPANEDAISRGGTQSVRTSAESESDRNDMGDKNNANDGNHISDCYDVNGCNDVSDSSDASDCCGLNGDCSADLDIQGEIA